MVGSPRKELAIVESVMIRCIETELLVPAEKNEATDTKAFEAYLD